MSLHGWRITMGSPIPRSKRTFRNSSRFDSPSRAIVGPSAHELATLCQHLQRTLIQGVTWQDFQTSSTDVLNDPLRTGTDDYVCHFSRLFSHTRLVDMETVLGHSQVR